jgi:hypothetical protein
MSWPISDEEFAKGRLGRVLSPYLACRKDGAVDDF